MDFEPIRIATIAGRYLVFDPDAVAALRRKANTNGTLVGTAPQQPTQNIFLGLPIEIRPEEAHALLSQDLAYIVDDTAAHTEALQRAGSETRQPSRKAYIESLRRRKQAAHQVYIDMNAKRFSQAAANGRGLPHTPPSSASISRQFKNCVNTLAVTPTVSTDLVPPDACLVPQIRSARTEPSPLCRFLQGSGYYMTPGLRFGAGYSVYPGDPLRFHAHFMANPYYWDEEIPMLDIVGGGRLATAVKKAFLLGGEEPFPNALGIPTVRTFSVEWASM